jgi:hypothetical protein
VVIEDDLCVSNGLCFGVGTLEHSFILIANCDCRNVRTSVTSLWNIHKKCVQPNLIFYVYNANLAVSVIHGIDEL